MKTLRYLGPLEGVEFESAGEFVEVERGATIDVPDEVADGTPHTFHDGYKPKEGAAVDSAQVKVPGTEGLLAHTFDGAAGPQPCWEVVKPAGDKPKGK